MARPYRVRTPAAEDDVVTVGDLFPADDLIAQWVFQLTAVAQDLSMAERLFHDAIDADASPGDTGYHYRQMIARLYEAKRPILSLETHDVIRQWVESLPHVVEPLALLRSAYLPADGAVVDGVYAVMRHHTVHHAWVGSDELRDMLAAAADEQASAILDHDALTLNYEWPEAVMANAHAGDLSTDKGIAQFASTVKLAQGIEHAFVQLTSGSLGHYVDRIGMSPERFTRQVGTPRPEFAR